MNHPPPLIMRNLPDPFILSADRRFYLYATGEAEDGRFIPIYCSEDLVSWEHVAGAVSMGSPGSCNRRNFWAPEVLCHAGRFWLYYTASPDGTPKNTGNRVLVASANSPIGPFESTRVLIHDASLDGSPLLDADGRLWLYFVAELGNAAGWTAGRVYVDRLSAPDAAAGEPQEAMGKHEWQEGPCVISRDGRYRLFYSVGSWGKDDYHVRRASGNSPAGPFVEEPGIVLRTTATAKGPGHNNFFRGLDGADWIVYHAWDPQFTARYPRICRLSSALSQLDRA